MRYPTSPSLKTVMRSRRAGSLMPAIVVALIVVLAGTALVLDRLWLDNSKTELRAAAESAALAAGRELASDALLQKEFNADAYLMKARLAAARIAAENRVAGDTVLLNTDRDGDIRFGKVTTNEFGEMTFLETDSHPMSVAVAARRTSDRGSAVGLPMLTPGGPRNADVVCVAEASLDNHVVGLRPVGNVPLMTLPLAILNKIVPSLAKPDPKTKPKVATWDNQVEQRRGQDRFSYEQSTGEVIQQSDGIPEIVLRTHAGKLDPLANSFVVNFGGDQTLNDLHQQIVTGWTVDDLEPLGGELMLNAGVKLPGLKGVDSNTLAEGLQSVIGQSRVCLLYEQANLNPQANVATVSISGFVAGRVMSVKQLSSDCCEIVFQPAVMTVRGAVVASELSADAAHQSNDGQSESDANKYVYKLRLTN